MTLPEEVQSAINCLVTVNRFTVAVRLMQCVERILADLERARGIPAGWKLAPEEPNDDQRRIMRDIIHPYAEQNPNWLVQGWLVVRKAYQAALAAAPQPIAAEPPVLGAGQIPQPQAPASMTFDLDSDQVDSLVQFCSMDDSKEKPSPLRFDIGNGHSGTGLYASLAEYPDEGSIFLGAAIAPQPISAPQATALEAAYTALCRQLADALMDCLRLIARHSWTSRDRPIIEKATAVLHSLQPIAAPQVPADTSSSCRDQDRAPEVAPAEAAATLNSIAFRLGQMVNQYGNPDWSADEFLSGLSDIAEQLVGIAKVKP
jgi:hypothetical protein